MSLALKNLLCSLPSDCVISQCICYMCGVYRSVSPCFIYSCIICAGVKCVCVCVYVCVCTHSMIYSILSTLRGQPVIPLHAHTHTHTHTHRGIHTLQEQPHKPQRDRQHLDLRSHLHYMHAWTHMSGYYRHTPKDRRVHVTTWQSPRYPRLTKSTHTHTHTINVRCLRYLAFETEEL